MNMYITSTYLISLCHFEHFNSELNSSWRETYVYITEQKVRFLGASVQWCEKRLLTSSYPTVCMEQRSSHRTGLCTILYSTLSLQCSIVFVF